MDESLFVNLQVIFMINRKFASLTFAFLFLGNEGNEDIEG